MSVLTRHQTKVVRKEMGDGFIEVHLRFDDNCRNGHNSFAITGELELPDCETSGCIHGEIEEYAPEFKHLFKWHLCSTDEPMHYVANTRYWAKQGNLDAARNSAIWEDATLDQLLDEGALMERLPALLLEFRKEMEQLGFTY